MDSRTRSSRQETALKKEMILTGRKLWDRQYVDGSGGNISARLSRNRIICTRSLCSKGDLTINDFAVVDMKGQQLAGRHRHSSEILLHVEIYKSVPQAQAVIHCHPPHALAYALTGTAPQPSLVPEYEVFVGNVSVAPYETPGTAEFARSVLPYVRTQNLVLLQNHGIVCWADSVTQTEWLVEVFDTYCRALLLAAQTGVNLKPIPRSKIEALREIRRKLGFPVDSKFEI
jgi:L-fuculose-phosphate aldolase